MIDFELKFHRSSREHILDAGTPEIDMLMVGNRWQVHGEGVSVLNAKGCHLGNVKPVYPTEDKVRRLQDFFDEEFGDRRSLRGSS